MFAERLRVASAHRRKKREDLAREIGTSRYRIYRLVRGAKPTIEEVKSIAVVLNVPTSFLLGETNEIPLTSTPEAHSTIGHTRRKAIGRHPEKVNKMGDPYGRLSTPLVMGFLSHIFEWYFRQRLVRDPTIQEFQNQVELALGQVTRTMQERPGE